PIFSSFFAFFALSIVGIPFTGGFVSELLLVLGAFKYNIILGFFAATTLLIAILFVFRVIQKVLYGRVKLKAFEDLCWYELLSIIPLALLILAMGIFPSYFLQKVKPTAQKYTSMEVSYVR
ncbi:MAG TPA: NADH-quinone oxidoreductase subunit M, partial [Sulfurimonas sp.]|nr:NADH-quinone oxidoreductase subunit M [Sulfurimonas sp.]